MFLHLVFFLWSWPKSDVLILYFNKVLKGKWIDLSVKCLAMKGMTGIQYEA